MSEKKIKLIPTSCPICGTKENFTVVYSANFKPSDFNVKTFSARRLPDRIHYQLVKCQHDGLVRSNPVLPIKVLNQLYQKSNFTYQSEIPNLIKSYSFALQPILDLLPTSAQILEIGCGNGFLLEHLQSKGFINIHGIEPSLPAVNLAAKNIKKQIVCQPFDKKYFPLKSFDLIYAFQTFDHHPDPNQFIEDCIALLKKDGYLLLFNHNINSFSSHLLKEKSPIIDVEHTFLYDQLTIKKLAERHGLTVIKTYSPFNFVSLQHLIYLLPFSLRYKKILLKIIQKIPISMAVPLKLGNLCLIAQKQFSM